MHARLIFYLTPMPMTNFAYEFDLSLAQAPCGSA